MDPKSPVTHPSSFLCSFSMNSEVTLTNHSMFQAPKDQTCLLFKRNDTHNAVLYEDDTARYFLSTSNGMNKVKIRDTTGKMVVEVNRRLFLSDVFILAHRNAGKPIKVADVLRQSGQTSDSQSSMALHTEEGIYHWRKSQVHHWELYDESSYEPAAWTETVPGSPPTWELIVDRRASSILDYVLASLFYLKAEQDCSQSGIGLERLESRAASLSNK